ncbi:MAG: ATP-dependent DNA helicase RecG [Clostridia bacterium]|nr:ATP-dependent DNA helicase RecG [Clostridia bacterium]
MDIDLTRIRGIGPARLKAFEAAGIKSVRDLVMFLPRDYRDLSRFKPLAELRPGDIAPVKVRVAGEAVQRRVKRLVITKVYVTDDTDTLPVVWYNQPWLKDQMTRGRELMLYGRCEARGGSVQITSPTIEQETGILPVYRNIPGIPAKAMRQCVEAALKVSEGQWPDGLPEALRRRHGLCERNFAMRNAHFPDSSEALEISRRRIAFEELLLYQVALSLSRHGGEKGIQMEFADDLPDQYWQKLPFPPTGAQKKVLSEIAADLKSPYAMARMVQGDVGSGKTAVAFGAIYMAYCAGYQAALMAPTEVLARQHYDGAKTLLEPLGVNVGLLTGSLTQKQHRIAHEKIASGEWDVVIGTHALITEGVEYKNLGLAVTDEQHRFGVRQRTILGRKGEAANVLVMSATPIPRTLSLILFGDLDISIIDQLPPGRKPVRTRIVPEDKRQDMYGFLRSEVKKGRQVYVVCPLVEESEAVDALPAEQVYEDLKNTHLSDLRIELVHGKMKNADKDRVLETFRKGEADVLVSTTVIEVGVNVPNASVMVIENAERFGLAQLHQLRGRVGRGTDEAWCFLMAEPNERLKLLTSTNDGFKIAQRDMEIRGPGDLFGTRQSGTIVFGVGTMAGDTQLLKVVHDEARNLLKNRESEEAQAVISLAETAYMQKFRDAALN